MSKRFCVRSHEDPVISTSDDTLNDMPTMEESPSAVVPPLEKSPSADVAPLEKSPSEIDKKYREISTMCTV